MKSLSQISKRKEEIEDLTKYASAEDVLELAKERHSLQQEELARVQFLRMYARTYKHWPEEVGHLLSEHLMKPLNEETRMKISEDINGYFHQKLLEGAEIQDSSIAEDMAFLYFSSLVFNEELSA